MAQAHYETAIRLLKKKRRSESSIEKSITLQCIFTENFFVCMAQSSYWRGKKYMEVTSWDQDPLFTGTTMQ